MVSNNKHYVFIHNLTLFLTHPKLAYARLSELYNIEEKYRTIYDIFINQTYGPLYHALRPGTTFIDIGTNIGDTAIYFAMNPNITRIYSYEPIPNTYLEARKNIKKSRFNHKIHLFNYGLGNKYDSIHIDADYAGTGATKLKDAASAKGKEIKIFPLNFVLRNKKNVAIKCDCEGAEEYLFDDADLSNTYALMLEYHNCKQKVSEVLKRKGFVVRDMNPDLKQGIMYAQR